MLCERLVCQLSQHLAGANKGFVPTTLGRQLFQLPFRYCILLVLRKL